MRHAARLALALTAALAAGCAKKETGPVTADTAAPHPGAAVYTKACAECHEGGVARAPHKMFLQMMPTDGIVKALEQGVMQTQAAGLTPGERRAVAEYLTGHSLDEVIARTPPPSCEGPRREFDLGRAPAKAGWGVTRENQRFIPADVAGLTAADLPKLELKWAFAFPGANRARSQPTVAMGAVFVGSQDGTVYALDKETGCVRWTFRASAEVRTPVIIEGWDAASPPDRPLAYFADFIARVYAVDARTGELVWVTKVDDHANATVTGAPVLLKDRLYVPISSLEVTSAADPKYACCTFRGAVASLDARSGATVWKTHTIDEPAREAGKTRIGTPILAPSGAPVWNSPSIDEQRGVLYVGTGENYSSPANDRSDALMAFELATGKLLWHRQKTEGDAWNVACMMKDNPNCPEEDGPDVDFGAGTIIARGAGGRDLLLAGQKSGDVYALDLAKRGEPVWHNKVGRGGIQGGIHFGMALDGQRLYVPISDMTSPEAEVHLHDVPSKAGIYALDVATGKTLWSQPADNVCNGRQYCEAGISAAITAMPGAVLAGHMDGRLRAYEAETGKVLWEYDTTQDVTATDGSRAHGGSFGGGAGPIVQDGMLFAASGYGIYFHMPGNVLLAFAPGKR
ncbi:MAG: PQQ-binding-like beta-propeller repeat protein [Steroidobacteraceae bacterium]|jgi:polyvinyl alcohol dehydrogenase (cytochrome)|nr:PQQ-binding-like beta-propeller repeat protein [Steroidobacteraceae bacterium]